MVSYLPVGSEEATKWYVEQALRAGVGFINAIPVFIGREPYWQRRFAAEGLPIIGDDIKSQVGATITHRVLTRLFADRGVRIDRTYQLNFGGNTDFLNMLERERLESKKISKTNAVTSMLDYEIDADDIHVGPSDHVPWLKDRKWCHIRIEGTTFGDVPLNLELKLEVWDSPNSAGVITDAIRCLKLGPRPRPVGHARRAVGLLHEEPAAPAPRRRRAGAGRGVHPWRRHRDADRRRGRACDGSRHAGAEAGARPKGAPARRGLIGGRVSGVDYAPHRRLTRGRLREVVTRAWERFVVLALPGRDGRPRPGPAASVSEPVARALFRVGYHLWPQKRGDHPPQRRARAGPAGDRTRGSARLARGIYASYARFALELIRLPGLPADEPARLFRLEGPAHEAFIALWERCRAEGRGDHRGERPHRQHRGLRRRLCEARASRRTGWPTIRRSPSCSRCSTRARARWGVTIIPWRRLRDIFRVMRSPAVLGMVVDWGYRADDLPVRLMGAWTTLPAGPATLAARTGAIIMPGRRAPRARRPLPARDGDADRGRATPPRPRSRARPRRSPTRSRRWSGDAPEQWHTFKPMWPATAAESEALEARARGVVRVARERRRHRRGSRAAPAARVPAPRRRAVALARRLPDRPLYRLAYAIGAVLPWVMPAPARARPAQPRARLRLARTRTVSRARRSRRRRGTPRRLDAARARDVRSLGRLVRRVGAGARGTPPTSCASASARSIRRLRRGRSLRPEPGSVGSIQVAMHFGSVDLSGLYATRVAGRRVTAPMEQVADPDARAWFERVRGALGVTIVPIAGAAEALVEALERGEMVGLVADRVIGRGRGARVELFGAPARLPLGPAALSVQTGAPIWLQAVERVGSGSLGRPHRARSSPRRDDRREPRSGASSMPRRARSSASSRVLPSSGRRSSSGSGTPRWRRQERAGRPERAMTRVERAGRSRGPAHPHAGVGRRLGRGDDPRPRGAALACDVIAITDHERIDAAVAARSMAEHAGLPLEVIVGEEISTRGGHLVGLFLRERIRPWQSLRASVAQVHDQGGIAIVAHPLVPYPLCASARTIRRLMDEPDPSVPPGRARGLQPDDGADALEPTRAGVRRGARARGGGRPRTRTGRAAWGSGYTTFAGAGAADLRAAIEARDTGWGGEAYTWREQVGTFGRQLERYATGARDDLRGRIRRDGSGRDLGYPGGRARPPRFDASAVAGTGRAGQERP